MNTDNVCGKLLIVNSGYFRCIRLKGHESAHLDGSIIDGWEISWYDKEIKNEYK